MLLRPTRDDLKLIGYNVARMLLIAAVAGLIPLAWAVAAREWAPAADFLVMVGLYGTLGALGLILHPQNDRLDWSHGMVVVALIWLIVPVVGAVPLALSGHFGSSLDAFFDAMSGITTTGLTLVQDLDHMASSMVIWRHVLHFLGGQGIIIAALSLFSGAGTATLYHGEARDDQIFPSVRSTARFIWLVSILNGVAGITALSLVAYLDLGFGALRSFYHGATIFMAAFDTGGFAPQSTSIGYYHSAPFEMVVAVLMVAGAMSFGVHFALWRRRSVLRNLETKTILLTFAGTLIITQIGLVAAGAYRSIAGLGRQSFFQVLSAHTGTGFSTIPSAELATWGGLAFGGMAIAMALGGMASSTAGGVKSLRVGLTLRSIGAQVKQVLLPEGAVISHRFWQNGPRNLSNELKQAVMAITLLYVALYVLGAGIGLATGVPLQEALFESVSAAANVGLSVGVTTPAMPAALKLTYAFQMWAGRLEFIAIFALIGFAWSLVRGK
ncbi:MAG TPA: TrkH family potassium uptake protein [Actinobacteria bacterium]|nr:trk system potassium uptake protein TrkG [bacterium BMS3Bbin01]HDH24975.1 TrkH family potassium uptake protein [Actinomycetota bacterium]HDK44856.1 TrkH family potassium uptake protein [Actinomycetota bacterium]HDL49469.1 TrkH family potassium uptake protein [Actinomycetota bacterium]